MTSIKQMPFVRKHKSINHINIKMDKNAIVCRKRNIISFCVFILFVDSITKPSNHNVLRVKCLARFVYTVYEFFFLLFVENVLYDCLYICFMVSLF